MSKAGCPYDNAPMERFYNTFKSNFYNVTSFSNVEMMDELTTKYINWYNYVRPHSHNNYLTPMEARYKQVFIEQSVTKKIDQYNTYSYPFPYTTKRTNFNVTLKICANFTFLHFEPIKLIIPPHKRKRFCKFQTDTYRIQKFQK